MSNYKITKPVMNGANMPMASLKMHSPISSHDLLSLASPHILRSSGRSNSPTKMKAQEQMSDNSPNAISGALI